MSSMTGSFGDSVLPEGLLSADIEAFSATWRKALAEKGWQ